MVEKSVIRSGSSEGEKSEFSVRSRKGQAGGRLCEVLNAMISRSDGHAGLHT